MIMLLGNGSTKQKLYSTIRGKLLRHKRNKEQRSITAVHLLLIMQPKVVSLTQFNSKLNSHPCSQTMN